MDLLKARDLLNPEENINIFESHIDGNCQLHTHDFIEIVYIISGFGQHFIDGVDYNVEKGNLLFINFNQTHSFNSTGTLAYVNCLIKPEFLSQELLDSENAFEILALAFFEDFGGSTGRTPPIVKFRGKDLFEVETIIERMLIEFNEKALGYKSILKGYISVLLAKIFREMRLSDTAGILQQVNKITPEIIKYIEDNCFERITLKELAQKCFYNSSYFSRIFKEYYGKSLMEFIHEKRISQAVHMLKETSLNIEEVCHSVGYNDKKQFYKLFKQYYGTTPNKVRNTM